MPRPSPTRHSAGQPSPPLDRRRHRWPDMGLLTGIALLLRLLYLVSLSGDPWLTQPIVDEIVFRKMALAVIHGGESELFPLFLPPLWPLLMAGWYAVFGSEVSFLSIRLLNTVIGALSVPVTYLLLREMVSRRAALISGLITASTGVLIHLHTTGLATSLFMLLLPASMLLTLRAARARNTAWSSLLAGIVWGVTTMCRPLALLPAVVSAGWLLFATENAERDRRIALAGLLIIGVLLPILPFSIINAAHGDFTLLTSNGGVNFYFGNNPESSGYMATHPVLGPSWSPDETVDYASFKAGKKLRPSQSSSWYYREGLRNWAEHPGQMLTLLGRKFMLLISGVEIGSNGDWQFWADHRPFLRVLMTIGAWWLLPLGMIGLLLHRWTKPSRYLGLILAAYLVTVLMFFITTRFRAPALPLITPFAVIAIGEMLAARTRSRRIGITLSALLLTVAVNLIARPLGPPPDRAYGYVIQGRLYKNAGDHSKAIEMFGESLKRETHVPAAHLYLGDYARAAGDYDLAVEHYRAENLFRPDARAYRGLGISFRELGMHDSARVAFRSALELDPEDDQLRQAYAEEIGEQALAAAEDGQWKEAVLQFRTAQTVAPENPFFAFGRAHALHALGDTAQANGVVDSLYQKHPEFPPVKQWVEQGWRPGKTESSDGL